MPAEKNQKKRTLENRLNDLTWKEWLKFQKSFFFLPKKEELYFELIRFFTKQTRPDQTPSEVLLFGGDRQRIFYWREKSDSKKTFPVLSTGRKGRMFWWRVL